MSIPPSTVFSTGNKNPKILGESMWSKMPKVNSELFTLTYGSIVMQLLEDYEDVNLVNEQLEKMGHNIGVRVIDEFLAKTNINNCSNFKETSEIIGKVAFRMFLGISADVTNFNSENNTFSLIFSKNPFTDFVEIPPQFSGLCYCKILCGIIRGALEMVQLSVECTFVKDMLKGDDINEMRVELKGIVKNVMSDEYNES